MSKRTPVLISLVTIISIACPIFADNNNQGFLTQDEVADSVAILPPPPTDDSILFIYDKTQYEKNRVLRETERGKQAILDAKIFEPNFGIAKVFSEAFGYELNQKKTPEIVRLLNKLGQGSDLATASAKKYYMTTHPFKYYNDKTCYPKDEKYLKKNGGYPSGHSAYGWAAALILAEINPQRQNEILKRGFEIGQSRVICGYHWQNDVEGGRLVASMLVARLHTNTEFIKQLEKAKEEFQKIRYSEFK
ncbi:phosphatase PAP2 family protein [Neisseriaceae bacterium PsAf]|nr:phosphatase PAP2 family protein [Neisseriaceae bacterium PsAf]